MTKKMTDMNATERRQIARGHRAEAAIAKTAAEAAVGFSQEFAKARTSQIFHSAQAKLWEAAAAHAEAKGFVRLT